MFARTSTFSGDVPSIDAGLDYVRDEVMPAALAMPGCAGLSLIVDRHSGRCIATSSWLSAEDRSASDDRFAAMRARGAELLGGPPVVEEWDVALMHRGHTAPDGACCRVTWGRAADLDAAVTAFRDRILPMIERADGFCSVSMFVDRPGGRICGTVTFDSRAALEGSRESAASLRQTMDDLVGMDFEEIAEFELALHHLRIPELV